MSESLELRILGRVAEMLGCALDLEVVVERGLELALEAAGSQAGALYLRDERRSDHQIVASRNLEGVAPPTIALERVDHWLTPSAALHQLPDAPEYTIARAAREAGFDRAILSGLLLDEKPQGHLILYFRPGEQVSQSVLPTVDAIVRHVSIALRNARIYQVSERRARLAHILREFSERALDPMEDAPLANLILDTAILLVRCDRGLVARVRDGFAQVIAGAGPDQDLLGMKLPVNAPYLDQALASRSPTITEDTSVFDPKSVVGQVAKQKGTASCMLVVMRHGDAPQGYIFIGSGTPRRFEPEEVEALQILSLMGGELLDRARRRREVDAERRRRDALLENLPMIVAVVRPDGVIDHMNAAARAFARDFEAMPSGDWREGYRRVRVLLPDGSTIKPEEGLIARAFRGEHPEPHEVLLVSPDGEKRMNAMSAAAPLFDPAGKVEAVVTTLQDVTALRELADARDRFLRVASHELRSPLTALRATASLFEIDPSAVSDPERRQLLVDRVQRQVARLTRLVEQLIDSARISGASEPPLEKRACDLVQLCREVIAAPRASTTPRIVLDAEGVIEGSWDPNRLEQVLTNLISNAARYSPADSTITIRLRADETSASFEVIDQGIGIPAEQIERVFTPFFRASNAAARHKGGLGLGLHIANEIVRRHGGTMQVTSTVGAGSRFIVELPRG